MRVEPDGTLDDSVNAYIRNIWRNAGENYSTAKEFLVELRVQVQGSLESVSSRRMVAKYTKDLARVDQNIVKAESMMARTWHSASSRFWAEYKNLPGSLQKAADKAFKLARNDPGNRGLNWEALKGANAGKYSIRINQQYRAIGWRTNYGWHWDRIIPHTYNLLK